MSKRPRALFALLSLVSACAGRSAESTEQQAHAGGSAVGGAGAGGSGVGGGGATNLGGGAGVGNSGGGAGASNSTCPSSPPNPGSPCSYTGPLCQYSVSQCTSEQFECLQGTWVLAPTADGAAYTCVNFRSGDLGVPKDGDSCACRGLLDCTIDDCGMAGQVHAVCDNTSWHVTVTPCTDKPCGSNGLTCKVGELCQAPSRLGDQYACRADPCAEQNETTSCSCAASLCATFETCNVTGSQLRCDCPTCG